MDRKGAPETVLVQEREGVVEGERVGHIAVVDLDGRLLAHLGDPEHVTYLRSAAKPFQALPLVLSGAMERFGFSPRELALACSSHSAEPLQLEVVRGMLQKIGLPETALACGAHEPMSEAGRDALRAEGGRATVIHNNCSGKHAGMLAACLARGFETKGYQKVDHPLQQEIAEHVARLAGVRRGEMIIGVDGCGVPCFGLPLRRMAHAFVRFAAVGDGAEILGPDAAPQYGEACRRIRSAMVGHPEMVAGPGRVSTELMKAFPERILSKGGAHAILCGALLREKLGYAIKMADGFREGIDFVLHRMLAQLGIEGISDRIDAAATRAELKNHAGDIVGHQEAGFRLRRERRAA